MAIEQYFQQAVAQHEMAGEDEAPLQKWKSVSAAATASDNANGCLDCNICLDFAQDPVVTLCGHLYCWPCIYKWLYFQSISTISDQEQQCPVCKADISHTTLVPLYGRGQSLTQVEPECKGPHLGMAIPPRPPACGVDALMTTASSTASRPGQPLRRNPYHSQSQSYQHQQFYPQQYGNYGVDSPSMFNLGGTTTTNNGFHPVVGMLGEMVYARVFGNSGASLYAYPNSYHLTGNSSPRMRRQEMQANKSLNRISIFLFCCFVLCLLLF
ncbi:hypothetical protein HHK36_001883 [Tetracentron sinense]|uniref:E3 ubiquitin-protein ligase RMA n=1 Tax=Tetracentron sinense TaxID=13715 RepID=A0A834ZUG0_TETSI|nr:hypothetical protein HHK36_001883 [Tetracentron sinense]